MYSSSGVDGQQVAEFKQMVKNLHAANIEVILDAGLQSHGRRCNHLGPTLCERVDENAAYYRLLASDNGARFHMDYTGCGKVR